MSHRAAGAVLLLLVVHHPTPVAAQSPAESHAAAQAVLDRALRAYGGSDKVRSGARQFTIVLEGELVHRNQSPSASRSVSTPFRMVMAGDLDKGRLRSERVGSYPGGFYWTNIDVLDSGRTRQVNLGTGTVTTVAGADPANYRGALERLPHAVLARLDQDRRAIASGGSSARDGRTLHTIIAPVNGSTVGWYHFDARTGLLDSWDRMIGDNYAGDAVVRIALSEYRAQDGTMIPGRIEQSTAGEVTHRFHPTLALLGKVPDDSFFTLPPGLIDPPRPGAVAAFQQVGPGVYMGNGLAGGYKLLIADLGDHLAVMESPNSSEACEAAIARIAEQFPGKPIRYVIPTHHHDDHAGGLRAFIAVGAVVVTTRGNAELFRAMSEARHTIEPDQQGRVQRPVRFEFVEGRKVLEGGGTRLEVIDIGPSPHADEMLVGWVPASGFIFQGDLFNTGAGSAERSANLTTVHFADWLARSGLQVDSIGGVHSQVRTRAELDVAAARMRERAAAR